MQGVEIAHCNATIQAVLTAAEAVWQSTVEEALCHVLCGKGDTLGMDAVPEITILGRLKAYDRFSAVVTEETGSQNKELFFPSNDPSRFRTVYICDPTDRSAQMQKMLATVTNKKQRVGDVVRHGEFREAWIKECKGPIEITGSTSAVSCVRRGIPLFTVIVNYLTRQLFVSCEAGNSMLDLGEEPEGVDLAHVLRRGRKIFFRDIVKTGMQRFTTFMGKSGYRENFMDSGLMDDDKMADNLHYDLPGGPSRVLYLSNLQPEESPIGFVLANGEKITEWIHWLTFVRFARKEYDQSEPALLLYEICHARPWTKEGILMSTSPQYSIFMPIEDDGHMVINVGRFASHANPSKIRSTLIVAPSDNRWVMCALNQYSHRPITFFSE